MKIITPSNIAIIDKNELNVIKILILANNRIFDYNEDNPRIHVDWESFIEHYGFNILISNEELYKLYRAVVMIRQGKEKIRSKLIHLYSNDGDKSMLVTCKKVANKTVSICFEKEEDKSLINKGTEKQWLDGGILPKSYSKILTFIASTNNTEKRNVTYTEICKALNISRRNCITKVQNLVQKEYLAEIQIGREKFFSITDIGQKSIK